MKREIKAPSVGESITEVRILRWAKKNGESVKVNELLLEIESDKATVEVVAEYAGALLVDQPEGATVKVGSVIGAIDEGAAGTVSASASPSAPAPSVSAPVAAASPQTLDSQPLSPAVRKIVSETGINPASVSGTGLGGRLTKGDVLSAIEKGVSSPVAQPSPAPAAPTSVASSAAPARQLDPRDRRQPMSLLRQKIADRLVSAQHTAAILTTFNEVDMSFVNTLRNQHKDAFKAKHGVGLGYMSFFSRAVIEAIKEVPLVNGSIDGKDIISRDYVDLGIAVGTPRGLVVPVLRDAQKMGFLEIEKGIAEFALKAKDGKLSIKDLAGGTFTISNGGTYGSLLSTPILTPPQTGILGMHKIQERPIAVSGQVVIRPMMYVALSYDHRLIDGKEAVTFLVKMKEFLENPDRLGLQY